MSLSLQGASGVLTSPLLPSQCQGQLKVCSHQPILFPVLRCLMD